MEKHSQLLQHCTPRSPPSESRIVDQHINLPKFFRCCDDRSFTKKDAAAGKESVHTVNIKKKDCDREVVATMSGEQTQRFLPKPIGVVRAEGIWSNTADITIAVCDDRGFVAVLKIVTADAFQEWRGCQQY